MLKFAKSFDQL